MYNDCYNIGNFITNLYAKQSEEVTMADNRLFTMNGRVTEVKAQNFRMEKELQNFVEKNMETLFNIRFLASEVSIEDMRLDSLGIDENNSPVIFEYKRDSNSSVLAQSLAYLNLVNRHKSDIQIKAMEKFGRDIVEKLDFSTPCIICVARDFNQYDEAAIREVRKNIRLVKYKKFDNGLIMFEQMNSIRNVVVENDNENTSTSSARNSNRLERTFKYTYEQSSESVKILFGELRDYIMELGDVSEVEQKYYVAYKRTNNFMSIMVRNTRLILNLCINPETVRLEPNFSRNVHEIGHNGTGDLEISVKNIDDLEKAKQYIEMAYKFGE